MLNNVIYGTLIGKRIGNQLSMPVEYVSGRIPEKDNKAAKIQDYEISNPHSI